MEDIIIRKKDEGSNTWTVEQGNDKSVECGWDEMMGLIAALTMPEDRPCLKWMSPKVKKYIPSDGDFVVSGWENEGCKCQWVAIVRGDNAEDGFYDTYYGRYNINNESDKRGSWYNESCDAQSYTRPATEEEIKFALDGLHEDGNDWDFEHEEIVEWEWEPSEGDSYYYPWLGGKFIPQETSWMGDNIDQQRLSEGWVTRSEEECKSLCNKLNEAIKNVKQ